MTDKADDQTNFKILGDINPKPDETRNPSSDEDSNVPKPTDHDHPTGAEMDEDKFEHSGTRDLGGGGAGTETGGSRNYRTGSGATGSDIGKRPE